MFCAPALRLACNDPVPPPVLFQPSGERGEAVERPLALVIDDEHIIADTIAQILKMSGFEAVAVYSGGTALEQAWAGCPDLVITDVVMPEMNGIETAKRLLQRCPSAKILMLSGQAATSELMKQAREEGFQFELLAKPLHPEDLLSVLRRLGY